MKTCLYLGTDPTSWEAQRFFKGHVIHLPVIEIVPRSPDLPEIRSAYADLKTYTHFIFTSKNAVRVFFEHLPSAQQDLEGKVVIAIGKVTAACLVSRGVTPSHTAEVETQEGVIALLNRMDLDEAYFFLPRSALSRPILTQFFIKRQIRFQACDLYDTVAKHHETLPDLKRVDAIFFTSPSTVAAFITLFGSIPKGKQLLAIGPITELALKKAIV